jgi:hypothetical protein
MNLAVDTEKINDDFVTVSFVTISFDLCIVNSGLLVMICDVENSGL